MKSEHQAPETQTRSIVAVESLRIAATMTPIRETPLAWRRNGAAARGHLWAPSDESHLLLRLRCSMKVSIDVLKMQAHTEYNCF